METGTENCLLGYKHHTVMW